MLNVTAEENGSEVTVFLEGKLDTGTAPQLSGELEPRTESFDAMILDLEKLSYVSSAGLRVFLATDQAMSDAGKTLKFRNVPGQVMDIFDMTGFSGVLTII